MTSLRRRARVAVMAVVAGLLVLPAGTAHAANTIRGDVTDGAGDPITGICVQIYGSDATLADPDELVAAAETNASGSYSVDVEPGDYLVYFTDCTREPALYVSEFHADARYIEDAEPVSVPSTGPIPDVDAELANASWVSGMVTQVGDDAPIEGICVNLYAVDVPFPAEQYLAGHTTAANDGRYTVGGIAAGDYTVEFIDCTGEADFVGEWWDDRSTWEEADVLEVHQDTEETGVNAALVRAGAIAGTTTDEAGQPLVDVCVDVRTRDQEDIAAGSTISAPDGTYRVGGLPPASYEVQFSDCSGNPHYIGEWYDDAEQRANATAVLVASGGTTSGVDAALVLGGSITGRVTNAAGDPIAAACVYAVDPAEGAFIAFTETLADGTYDLGGLDDGDHQVVFDPCVPDGASQTYAPEWYEDETSRATANRVSVLRGQVTAGVDAELERSGEISGRVTDEGGAPLGDICVEAYVASADAPSAAASVAFGYAEPDSDGTFTIEGLRPDDYRVLFTDCTGSRTFAYEWYRDAGTFDAAARVLVAADQTTTQVNATLGPAGTISGRVTGPGGAPVRGVCAEAFTADGAKTSFVWYIDTPDDGSYRIDGLRPGAYNIRFNDCDATDETVWVDEWWDDEASGRSATPIDVRAGDDTSGIDAVLAEGRDEAVRLFGSGRIQTAIAISADTFGAGEAGAVVLARENAYPDALAGTPFAVANDAPLLLTFTDFLDNDTAAEISRVLPDGATVYLLGGTSALSATVEANVNALGYETQRLQGPTRFETAVAIAEELDDPGEVLLTTGINFPDALAAGAAATLVEGAVLLTDGDASHPATRSFLDEHADAQRFAIGGPATRAHPEAIAISGSGREATAVATARYFFGSVSVVGVARGDQFPDSLAGGAHIGRLGGPMLLTPSDQLNADVADYLCDQSPTVHTAYTYGGPAALNDETVQAIASAIGPSDCGS